ncbi:MAG: transketolase [Bacillota bacterium]
MEKIDLKNVNTIRCLSAEAIQNANSGHPGLPLGAAEFSYTLFDKIMKHNPNNSNWDNRDRFVLSAGHGSALLYTLLHLYGYDLSLEELKEFRQMGSLTPGHPEYGHTDGVEVTTGPLGQGIANGVGMAIAETKLADRFNKSDLNIVDHYTYVLAGDGCMMEGVSSEASSLAGTLGLDKLIILYDSNNISIEGSTDLAFTEDVYKRYEAYGFQVLEVNDGTDFNEIQKAINKAKSNKEKPSFIKINTTIGNGCKEVEGKAKAHGAPLGEENVKKMREKFGFSSKAFEIDTEVEEYFETKKEKLEKYENDWKEKLEQYKNKYPKDYEEYNKWMNNDFSLNFIKEYYEYEKKEASRKSSGMIINEIAKNIDNFIGGSADLAPSNKTHLENLGEYSKSNRKGRNFHFGVREFAMGAITNGMCLHGGLNVFNATFFVFSDYMKPSMRMASIMDLPVTYVLTHDSVGVGEDGPTHQPIEQLAMLRSMPNFNVIRPADSKETIAAWELALKSKKTPTALVLTRQNLEVIEESSSKASKGGYVLRDFDSPDVLLMASGSEVNLINEASKLLEKDGIKAKVVSMPSFEIFDNQEKVYKEQVIDQSADYRFAIEAGSSMPWYKYIEGKGDVLGIDRFGMSAPGGEIFEKIGFTVKDVVKKIKENIN